MDDGMESGLIEGAIISGGGAWLGDLPVGKEWWWAVLGELAAGTLGGQLGVLRDGGERWVSAQRWW